MKALAVASGIVFWTLVLGAIVLIFFAGGDEGEPVALLNVEAPPPAAAPAASVTTDGVDLPPGFSVTGPAVAPAAPPPAAPMLAPPGQGTTMMPTAPAEPPPPGQGTLDTPGPQGALPGAAGDPAGLAAGIDLSGGTELGAVPVADLVEESDYGPLPKIAADGRR